LKGERLNGDFGMIHIKARRAGSKGTEWLLIKKKDDEVVPKFDIDAYDTSVLTGRTMGEIAGDKKSAEGTSSRPATRGKVKAAWLADAIARTDKKRKASNAEDAKNANKGKTKASAKAQPNSAAHAESPKKTSKSSLTSVASVVKALPGAVEKPMPSKVRP